ncbi:hypothetical protein CWE22_08505 [Pseudidiomarina aestuarii]|uniref:Uncharacterized protein n=1 Tax=Pseudidiomarina aestuarii TaxID=624146 RepID=A0A7Z7EUI2_9GAMM|nr:hypothetical protein [Pseudidiomarina aestuarii]RUO42172.1 hypothetical protein CWE22_08505 [Pseudidiomarina aestuarii]
MIRIALAFLVALVVASITAAIIQTQFNIAALQDWSVEIDWALRKEATFHDIINFSPTFAIILGTSLLVSLPVAYFIDRRRPNPEPIWFLVGGAVGLWVAFLIVDALLPMPTLIAVNRTLPGLVSMVACGGLAGYLFARVSKISSYSSHQSEGAAA